MNTITLTNEQLMMLQELLSDVRDAEYTSYEEYVSDHWDIDFQIAGDEDEFENSLTDADVVHRFKTAEVLTRAIDTQGI